MGPLTSQAYLKGKLYVNRSFLLLTVAVKKLKKLFFFAANEERNDTSEKLVKGTN